VSNLWTILRNSLNGPEHHPIRLTGRSPVFVLLHGFMGTPREWLPLAQQLNHDGFAVQAPLLPGFGPDLPELPRVSLRTWLDSVLTTVRDCSPAPVILVGFSFGGALATIAASIVPPSQLVLLAPFSRLPLPFWYRAIVPVLARFTAGPRPFARIDFDDPAVSRAFSGWNAALDLSDPIVRQELRAVRFPWSLLRTLDETARRARAAACRVTCPVTIVQGRADRTVRPQDTRRFAQAFRTLEVYIETPGDHQLVDPSHPAFRLLQRLLVDHAEGSSE